MVIHLGSNQRRLLELSPSWSVDTLGTVVQVHIAHRAANTSLDVRCLVIEVALGAVGTLRVIPMHHLPAPRILDKQHDDQDYRNSYNKCEIPGHGCSNCILVYQC